MKAGTLMTTGIIEALRDRDVHEPHKETQMSGDSETDMGSYSALRPLDEALPGELDGEGWGSDDDWDN